LPRFHGRATARAVTRNPNLQKQAETVAQGHHAPRAG
jgi:hypothetical protein